jgi:hypothetical protein
LFFVGGGGPRGGGAPPPPPPPPCCACAQGLTYWTVIAPFMFMAACGVHVKLYVPAGTLAKETT